MSVQKSDGRFVWHELMTSDVSKARAFYGELFGWTIKDVPMGPMTYHLICLPSGRDIGGLVPTEASEGRPNAWVGYVKVDSTDAAVTRAQKLGGKVMMPAMDIPDVGRFAIVADPTGACTAAFQYKRDTEDKGDTDEFPAGSFCWNEVLTKDTAKCGAFYSEVYGWSTEAMDMGPMGTYTLFKTGDKQRGGMMVMPKEAPAPSHWLHYVNVENLTQSFEKAQKLGAKVVMGPTPVPNIGTFAIISDPTGAVVALFNGGN